MHDPVQELTASLGRLLALADLLDRRAVRVDERAHHDSEDEPTAAESTTETSVDEAHKHGVPPAVLERLERLESELNELDGKLLGPRGKRRMAEIRAEERDILDGLGFDSYLQMILSTTDASF